MQEQELWNEVLGIFNKSDKQINIYYGTEKNGEKQIETMGIDSNSILGTIILHTAGICIDNWIRVIGQKSDEHDGICQYNLEKCIITKGMLIIAQDIVGGIFAINISKYSEGSQMIWYFAPDTLEWECLDMNYAEFIEWLALGNTDQFYHSMRWASWEKDCMNINFDMVYLIYPFLWSNECNLDIATKRVVPFIELKEINRECAAKIFR